MIEIICYGDSNTYGYCPIGISDRYGENERWVERLQTMLGREFLVHNEGLNGRTTDLDDIFDTGRNGAKYLPVTLRKYPNADLLILMLGTNDLKSYFKRDAKQIADAAAGLVVTAKGIMKENAKILFVSPVLVGEKMGQSPFCLEFGENRSRNESLKFAELYRKKADALGVESMSAADYAGVSDADSLHLSLEGHATLADAFYEKVADLFPENV